ncbi:hypothetical protein PHSC3_001807 [Chlamydiales bacterium STE3]|nr:hypothetical protein PHSC3_001807 [Chlamydiales bacterium STE3]
MNFIRENKLVGLALGLILKNYNEKTHLEDRNYKDLADADIENALMVARKITLCPLQGTIIKHLIQFLIDSGQPEDALACFMPWQEKLNYLLPEVAKEFIMKGDVKSILKFAESSSHKNVLLFFCANLFIKNGQVGHALKISEEASEESCLAKIASSLAEYGYIQESLNIFHKFPEIAHKQWLFENIIDHLEGLEKWDSIVEFAEKVPDNIREKYDEKISKIKAK